MQSQGNKPLVSVIMPAFNRQELIGASIESVQLQSIENWELLIVDDGSTDETYEVAASYAALDPRIQVAKRSSTQKGPSACRNQGLGLAQAPHCLFLDSDDLLAPECLAGRLAAVATEPQIALQVFQMQFFFERPGDNEGLFFYANPADALASTIARGSPWGISCPLWQTAVLRTLGGFDESLTSWEDWDLHVRAFALGYTYKIYSTIDCYCRQGRVSLTSQHQSVGHLLQRTNLYLKIGKLFEQQRLPALYREILTGKCLAHCGQLNEGGQFEAAQAAWNSFKQAGIFSSWQGIVGQSYLTLRRKVLRDKEALSTKLVRRAVGFISSKYLVWVY